VAVEVSDRLIGN